MVAISIDSGFVVYQSRKIPSIGPEIVYHSQMYRGSLLCMWDLLGLQLPEMIHVLFTEPETLSFATGDRVKTGDL